MAVMNLGGSPVIITPVVDAKGPMKMISTLEERLSTPRLMWFLGRVVGPFMGNIIEKRFASHGDATVGGTWAPLTSYTERLKRAMGAPSNSPNVRTGEMLAHLVNDHAIEAFPLGALIRIPGSSTPAMEKKIRTAQEGEEAGSNAFGRSTPARPVLALGEIEEAGISKLFDAYLWFGL